MARRTFGANHVTFVPEMGGPFRSHGPKPRGSHGDRRHAGVDGSLNSGFLYFSLPHARPTRGRTHRFLIRRDEAAHQDRSWVHEFPADQLRAFAGTCAYDQRAGLLAVEAPLTSSMTLSRAAVALSSAATV